MRTYATVDEYIKTFPASVRSILEKVRQTIKQAAPQAEEVISYGIPTFKLNGNLVHFGGAKNHVGFYPGPGAIEEFKADISNYQSSKGTVQFQLDEPIPYDLIKKITEYRVKQTLEK